MTDLGLLEDVLSPAYVAASVFALRPDHRAVLPAEALTAAKPDDPAGTES